MEKNFGGNFLGEIFWKDILGFFWEDFFWEDFFGRIFLGGFLGGLHLEEFFVFFNVEGIDLIVKILVFVKILSIS